MTGTRLLYLDLKWPTPDRDAASQRTVQLLTQLVVLGFTVEFAAAFPVAGGDDRSCAAGQQSALHDLGVRDLTCCDESEIGDHVARHPDRYAVAVLSWPRVASRFLALVRRANRAAFVVFDTHDVNHVREHRQARITGNAAILRRALVTMQRELACVRGADCTLAITPADARMLRDGCPGARVELVTMQAPPVAVGQDAGPDGRHGTLFLGSLQTAHNVDAAVHLTADILPELRRIGSGTLTTIVGSDPPAIVHSLAAPPEVTVAGHVDDLGPLFARHRLFASPLRFGSGIKGKLLTAVAMGLPIVATPISVEGMGLASGRDALIAAAPRDFAAAMLRLQADDALWRGLRAAARRQIAQHHAATVLEAQISRVFSRR